MCECYDKSHVSANETKIMDMGYCHTRSIIISIEGLRIESNNIYSYCNDICCKQHF